MTAAVHALNSSQGSWISQCLHVRVRLWMWSCIADCNDFFFHPFSPELLLYVRTKWLTKIENESYWRHHDGKMCESCMALLQRRNLQKQHAISEVPCQRHFYSATGYCLLHKSNSTQCKRLHAFFFGANSMHTSGSAAERPWGARHWWLADLPSNSSARTQCGSCRKCVSPLQNKKVCSTET
jgi:hypothetical protein